MYKLLSLFAVLAIAFAAPVAEPEAKPGTVIAPGYPAFYQPLGLYPAPHLTYTAPVASWQGSYPAYPAYSAPIAYNKVYEI